MFDTIRTPDGNTEQLERWRRETDALAERQQRLGLAWAEKERQKLEARQAAESEQSRATLDMRQRQEEYWASVQLTWAATRAALRDRVAALQRSIMEAETRVASDDMAEAVAANGELGVLQKRLTDAERTYAQHMAAAPRRFG